MKLAIQGCTHGELSTIYASVLRAEAEQRIKVDALLLCGDFQAVRNLSDLHTLAVPPKYRQPGSFQAYYSGQLIAPILTLVIGGNHEASNYMHELYHGGWLAPNIYYMGAAGAVDLGGLTVAGISGIYKSHDYRKGRFETLPYDASTLRSCYHTRIFDVHRLKHMKPQAPDVVMSHDWPNTIERGGNAARLIKIKPYFKQEIKTRTLGSPPLLELLQSLRPRYWFSAHLHVKFAALWPPNAALQAETVQNEGSANPEAIEIDFDSDVDEKVEQTTDITNATQNPAASTEAKEVTRFLALDKCIRHSDFLQILDVASPEDKDLEARKAVSGHRVMPSFRYNKRWLAITKAFHPFFSTAVQQPPLPAEDDSAVLANISEAEKWISEHRMEAPTSSRPSGKRKQDEMNECLNITDPRAASLDIHAVQQFVRTAPTCLDPAGNTNAQPAWYTNPQTESFCRYLGIENKINPRPIDYLPFFVSSDQTQVFTQHTDAAVMGEADPNAIDIDDDDLLDESVDAADPGVTTLLDDDESNARWKEGSG